MNVSLTSRFEKLITDAVESGRYNNASEVVREGLRLFEEQEYLRARRLEELHRENQIGIDEADRGEFVNGEVVMAELKARIEKRKRELGIT